MGMFDRVIARCPSCNTEVEFQSKAGDCTLSRYDSHEVPIEIAKDIDGDCKRCPSCDYLVKIRIPFKLDTVCMIIVD